MEHVFNTRHGEYILASRIAMGGMGEVFLALDPGVDGLDRFVALKCLHGHFEDDRKVVEMFYREARLGSLFRHRNLVRVDAVGVIQGRHTMVMEFAPGVTLRQLLDRLEERLEVLPTPFILDIVRQLADALWYAHSLKRADGQLFGIVHRDLSPDNVLIGFDGVVRLLDFGVAAAVTSSNDAGLAGKVAYMSPEQCRGEILDARADLYSLGTLYWEMLQGRPPYPPADRILALRAITEGDLTPPASTAGRAGASDLDGLWLRLHAKFPQDRFPDAKSLGRSVDSLIERLNSPATETLGHWVQRLFPHESAELRTVCEKILRAPSPTENTVDLDKESFSLEYDDSPTLFRSAGAQPREVPPPAPVLKGSKTAEPDQIQLSPTEFTSVRQIRRWRVQRNLFMLAAAGLIIALTAVVLLRKEPAPLPPDAQVTFVVNAHPAETTLKANDAVIAQRTPAIIVAKEGDFFSLELSSPGYLPTVEEFWVREELADQGIEVRLQADRSSPVAPIGSIRVNYVPVDAKLSLDGQVRAERSPAFIENIQLNTLHTLRLEQQGFQTLFVDLRLPSDSLLEFDLQMVEGVPLARLSVESTPEGATVLIDGQEVGTTPLENLELPANTAYALQLRSSGYREWRKGVMLQSEDQQLSVQLERESAAVRNPRPNTGKPAGPTKPTTASPAAQTAPTRPAELPYRMLD